MSDIIDLHPGKSDDSDLDGPAFYEAILAVGKELHAQHPEGVETEFHGITAWRTLTAEQQLASFPIVLGAYVQVVYEEEREMRTTRDAKDPAFTYLADEDLASLWSSATASPRSEIMTDRSALLNALQELDVLKRRLDLTLIKTDGGS